MSISDVDNFGNYLNTMGIVPEKRIPFYCNWVKQYLSLELRNPELSDHDKLICWVSKVSRYKEIEDWEVRQAEEAVQMYLEWRHTDSPEKPHDSSRHESGEQITVSEVLNKTKELIRLRH
jgi:hypothetical protein